MTIRRALAADAASIGAVHVQAWREAYADLIPDEVLERLDPERRARMWRDILADEQRALFVGEIDNAIVGFGACGPQRDESLPYDGEIAEIYVLRRAQRHGIGRRLMAAMADALRAQGCASASLWVIEANAPARAFYERLGGKAVTRREQTRDGFAAIGVAYAWDDLGTLV